MGGFEPVPGGSTAKINQDRGVAIYPFTDLENCGMFGVYDGHGRAGEKVSEFVLQHLPAVLAAQGEALWSDVGGTLKYAYVQVDSDLANEMDASAGANGSPARVWHNLRGLAMARSIGDHAAATVGVISEPEITEYDIVEDDFAIIIATDGVWELLSSQQVADILPRREERGRAGDDRGRR
ncbi:protein phosphatase 2c containing protein [Chrysochromulina tobinii]|uniref:Protein phosphatase 2c containing protein n=1 Tax=Chrysochromulina tobinii TaxID=1460289 RepID=A0A0M0K6M1_9EUKA|nr:protein phosphatase 2c containing protein [Chrysochromulina tobinii]|eukprot:KOO34445.1 protein phosphatase 2c containing protein [Chrysochromulina sp. CCMP291]